MSLPVLPDPTNATVVAMHEGCRRVEQWMTQTDDLEALNEARHWLSAVEEYLSHKQAEGPAQTSARLLEARIGELVPERYSREKHGGAVLSQQDRSDFRMMSEHRDVWVDKLPLARRRVLRLIRDDIADVRPIPEAPTELEMSLRLGDFRQVLEDIPDGSVDLILTDPPYPAEFLPLWSDLAIFAKRKLADHGTLAAMSGKMYLPEVMQRLGEHLEYRWVIAYMVTGGASVVHARRVQSMWKPVLVYGPSIRRLHDVATSKAADKDFHGWGQSESGFYDLLRLLADPGSLVVDPFLGGGTTAVVARALGCHFIGAEVDADVFKTAEQRLSR